MIKQKLNPLLQFVFRWSISQTKPILKFEPIKATTTNRMTLKKDSSRKIQLNSMIQKLKTVQDFYRFYEQNCEQLNLINYTSYIRRFTDIQMQQHHLTDKLVCEHTFAVLKEISVCIENKTYNNHQDDKRDLARSLSMILSLSIVLKKLVQENFHDKIEQLCKLVIQEIQQQQFYEEFNQQEVAQFFRALSQMGLTLEYQKFQTHIHQLHLEFYSVSNLAKLLHSIAQLHPNPDELSLVADSLTRTMKIESPNDLDIESIFLSITKETIRKFKNIGLLIQTTQKTIYLNSLQMSMKSIGIAMKTISDYPELEEHFDQMFFHYIEGLIRVAKPEQFTFLAFAHIIYFYFVRLDKDNRIQLPFDPLTIDSIFKNIETEFKIAPGIEFTQQLLRQMNKFNQYDLTEYFLQFKNTEN